MKFSRLVNLMGILFITLIFGACNSPLPFADDSVSSTDDSLLESTTPESPEGTDELNSPDGYSGFFTEELQRAGVERVGQPIEGFSAFIYLEVFPGFESSDFDSVSTLEGIYNIEGGELKYVRTGGSLVTSAEETISEEGYRILLENLSRRLGVEVESESDVAALLEKLREGDVFPKPHIFDDFSIWLPDNWHPYDLGYSVLFVHEPDLDLESYGATEGYALAPYIQVIKQEMDIDELLEQSLWTEGSEYIESIDDVRIGNDERIRVVAYAAGADGQELVYVFDAEDGRVFLVSTYPYQAGSQDTDDFERAVQSFMINYLIEESVNGD